jgi:hypothetical protein
MRVHGIVVATRIGFDLGTTTNLPKRRISIAKALYTIENDAVHSCHRSVTLSSHFYIVQLKRSDSSDTFCSVVLCILSIAN